MRLFNIFVLLFALFLNSNLYAVSIGKKLDDGLGISLPWKKGSLNLRLANQRFQLYFLDAESKVMAPNVEAASIRYATYSAPYDYTYASFELSKSGDSFVSAFYVPPSYLYWVSIIFLKKEDGKLVTLKTFDPVQLSQVEPAGASTPPSSKIQKNTPDNPSSIFGANAKPARNSSNKTLGPDYQDVEGTNYQ